MFDITLFLVLFNHSLNAITGWTISGINSVSITVFICVVNVFTGPVSQACLGGIGTLSTTLMFSLLIYGFSSKMYSDYKHTHAHQNPYKTDSSIPEFSDAKCLSDIEGIPLSDKSIGGMRNNNSTNHIMPTQLAFYNDSFKLAACFGICSFCFMGHTVLPSIFSNMAQNRNFSLVVDVTFVLIVFWSLLISSLAYLANGHEIHQNVVYNLDPESQEYLYCHVFIAVTVSTKCVIAAQALGDGIDATIWMCREMIISFIKYVNNGACFSFLCDYDDDDDDEDEGIPSKFVHHQTELADMHPLSPQQTKKNKKRNSFSSSLSSHLRVETENLVFSPYRLNPSSLSQDQTHLEDKSRKTWKEVIFTCLVRATLPLLALRISYTLPEFIILLSLIGCVFGVFLSAIVPTLCYLKLFKWEISPLKTMLLTLCVIFSIVCSVLFSCLNLIFLKGD
jgi:hypothetical protein